MNVVIWILQIVLGLAFLAAGGTKLAQSRAALTDRMPFAEDVTDLTLKLIGALEVLAAVGLLLPALTGVAPALTPAAALGLLVLMVGAAALHLRRGERHMVPVNAALMVLAAIVAWARLGPYQL